MSDPSKDKGLEPERYHITKANGEPTAEDAKYFVLRYDTDIHARKALAVYADSVRADNPTLAEDIFAELKEIELS